MSDTIVPEIVVKPDIEGVDRGTTIHPADYVEVNDLSEVAVYFVVEDGDNESLEIPSDLDNDVTEINYTVVAVDAESNRSEELSVAIPIIPKVIEEPETTEDAKSSSNPFSGMTYDELGAIDTTNFTDADWNNYIAACQEAQEAIDKNKPATEKQPWTGKPFEEMTQEELKAIDTETLTKEDKDRWIKRYDETIAEKMAEFDQQNQSSNNTTTPAPSGDDAKWANPPEKKPIEADGWKCY